MTAAAPAAVEGVRWRPGPLGGVVIAERHVRPLTVNDGLRNNPQARRAELRKWRAWAKAGAEDAGVPHLTGPVLVSVEHLRKTRSAIPDCGAPLLAQKAVLDGLVEAGVLDDDGPDIVTRLVFEAPLIVGHDGLRVVVAPLPGPRQEVLTDA